MKHFIFVSVIMTSILCKAQTSNRPAPSTFSRIAVTTPNKDTIYFSETESVCKMIKDLWDTGIYGKKPVILFVSNKDLYSAYKAHLPKQKKLYARSNN